MPLIYRFVIFFFFTCNAFAYSYTPPIKYRLGPNIGGTATASLNDTCSQAMSPLSAIFSPTKAYVSVHVCQTNRSQTATTGLYSESPLDAMYKYADTTTSGHVSPGIESQSCQTGEVRTGILPNVSCSGACVAPSVFNPLTNSCEVSCTPDEPVGPQHIAADFPVIPQVGCVQSCEILWVPDGAHSLNCNMGGGIGLCWFEQEGGYKKTGASCATSQPTPTPPAHPEQPPVCPSCDCLKNGQSFGTVNGAIVCVGKGTVGSAPVKTENPPVIKTETPAPTPENPNPTPVVTVVSGGSSTVTPAPAGAPPETPPSITTDKINPDGSSSSSQQSKDGFCESTPNSSLCKAQTSCEEKPEGPECKHLCEKYPDNVACTKAEDFIGKASDIPPDPDFAEQDIDAPTSFGSVNVASSNSCPAPLTMVIAGAPMIISSNWLCDYASAFKQLVIAFALMAAASIVMAGVKGDSNPYQKGLF